MNNRSIIALIALAVLAFVYALAPGEPVPDDAAEWWSFRQRNYLVRPVEVLRDVGRVLAPGGPLVVTFSNRCFPTKVIAAWQMLDDEGHQRLVERFFEAAGNWTQITSLDRSPVRGHDPLYAVVATSTGTAPSGTRG